MIRTASKKRLLRSPSWMPFCLPAMDKSWQGEPNVITSTGSISAPLTSSTLPRCFMRGKRAVVTLMGYGSISDAHTGVMPLRTPASGNPPEPSNKLPSLISIHSPPPLQPGSVVRLGLDAAAFRLRSLVASTGGALPVVDREECSPAACDDLL